MLQQATTTDTPPPSNRPGGSSVRHTAPAPLPVLSSSEPSLRFPRPQGNRRLASWISASDPDIMRSTVPAVEETALAESTFELITGTDSESQDGNYTESMGDSVGSLDNHRPDDIHSLDGTDYTHDGESLADEIDILPRNLSYDGADGPAPAHVSQRADRVRAVVHDVDGGDDGGDDDDDDDFGSPLARNRNRHNSGSAEGGDDARSRCSLEYTHHSLGTPSISTPDASRLGEGPLGFQLPGQEPAGDARKPAMSAKEKFVRLWGASADTRDYVIETAWAALPGLLFTAAFALLIPLLCNPRAQDARSPTAGPASTITATTTSVVVSTAKPSSWARPRPSPAGGMDLVPLDDDASDEWLFSARKPAISFTPRAQTDILVRVPDDVKQNWLAKDCLAVTAVRDSRQIETSSHPVDEGILLRFPRKEAHGVINLSLEATCRPRLQRLVKVHFGKGVMEEALEMTKNLAHDLTGLVPAAAQEAERRLEDARRSLGAVSDSVGNSVVFVSDNLLNKLGSAVAGARQSLEGARPEALGRVRDRVRDRVKGAADDISGKLDTVSGQAAEQVRRVQSRLQLALLDAQISANMWWLGATGRREAHDDYQRKAKEFVAKKHSAAKEAVRARRPQPEPVETAPRLWPRMRRPGRCQEKTRRAHKANTHECKAAT